MPDLQQSDILDDENFRVENEPFYLPQGEEIDLFQVAYQNKLPVMLVGPTGSGKTRLIEYMAWKLGRPLYTVACHSDLGAGDLTGRYIIKGDAVQWIDGPLSMAVKNGGIAYLDEVVEARKDVSVVIHPLTDHRRYMVLEKQGRIYRAKETFMLVVSYNPHYQSIVKELKPSTRQRFLSVVLNWPESDLETRIIHQEAGVDHAVAEKLVKAGNKIRNLVDQGLEEGVSTRELIYAATLLKSGLSRRAALSATMVTPLTYDQDLQLSILEVLKNYFDLS
ncbi:MAG: ATPase AAA [Desulfatitalea sp. BRH_c12]|nr:MAG: ATPase AAA [Desulfatitalea sp. BRH_c12]